MKTQKLFLTLFAFLIISWPSYSFATSGCCSHHGGVCGCDSSVGRQTCCDGTYSPSCTCLRAAVKTYSQLKAEVQTPESSETNNLEQKFCGAGTLYDKKDDADKSLTNFRSGIEKPLKDNQDKLNKRITELEDKGWIGFVFLLLMFAAAGIMAFVTSGCKTCENSKWMGFIKVVLWLFFIYLVLGGFSFLHP